MSRAAAIPGKRREADAYPTPPWVTRRLLEALAPRLEALRPLPGASPEPAFAGAGAAAWAPSFLEPCAGRGHIVKEIRRAHPAALIEAWELNAEPGSVPHVMLRAAARGAGGGLCIVQRDALTSDWPSRTCCIMNPPFSLAREFVAKALASGIPIVACLERIGFAASGSEVLRGKEPSALVLPQKVSFAHKCFYGPGKADFALVPFDEPSPQGTIKRQASCDAADYAWFVWGLDGLMRILPLTTIEERKEGSWAYGKASEAPAAALGAAE